MAASGSILGNSVLRREDPDLVRGAGKYFDDLRFDGMLHVHFVRSTVAHGIINSIDTSEAASMPGVRAVYTADNIGLADFQAFPMMPAVLNRPKTGFSLPVGDWMYDELSDFCEAAIDGLRHVPFIDKAAARKLWDRFKRDRGHTYWMKPMLLVALGSYADNCHRSFLDAAGAMKLRPRMTADIAIGSRY